MNDNIKAGSDIHAGDGGYSIGTKEKYDEFVKIRNQSLGKMRIRELALQALKHPDTDNDGLTVFDNDELAKFAELIVSECANVALWEQCKGYDVGEIIKKHFGVEE